MLGTRIPIQIARLACCLLAVPCAESSAQRGGTTGTIVGVVRDSLGNRIAGAQVLLAAGGPGTQSDLEGRFELAGVPAGDQDVVVRRLGYRPGGRPVFVEAGGRYDIVIELAATIQRLAPVVVRGRENLRGPLVGFYRRMDLGQGRYFTAEMIDQRRLYTMRDLMRNVPGVRVETVRGRLFVRMRGASVPPMVFLDGVRMQAGESDLGMLDPRSFAGIEVYSGSATIPAEFNMGSVSGQNGGVIVVWTREGQARVRQPRRGEVTGADLVADLIAKNQVYQESEVDAPARPMESSPVSPMYPDSLFAAGAEGMAIAEFVVDDDGRVDVQTISIVMASHAKFAEAARSALASARFYPAQKGGRAVAQVVQLPFRFTLERPKD